MNKTFKVVFNRARHSLMVANEITSSVQKKGTKTVLAVAAASLLASSLALAADSPAVFTWTDSKSLPQTSYDVTFSKDQQVAGKNYNAVIEAQKGAKGSLSNFALKATATVKDLGPSNLHPQFLGVQLRDEADVTFAGDTLNITMSTDTVGIGDNQITGLYTQVNDKGNDEKTKLTFSAKTVNIEATSTAKNGKSVYAIATYGGVINFTGDSVTLKTTTSTERSTISTAENEYSETAGLVVGTYGGNYGASAVTFSENTKLFVEATSTSEVATVSNKNSDRAGGSPAFGIKVDGGTLTANGSTTLTVNSKGANATGLQLSGKNYASTIGTQTFSSTATINNLTVTATSETGNAYGVRVLGSSGKDVKLTLNGTVNVKATGLDTNATNIRAIQASEGGVISVNADVVKAESSGVGVIALGKSIGTKIDINAKELTVKGAYGVWLQNNTQLATAPDKATSITINADKTTIDATENGLLVFSNGQLTINSDVSVKATNAIDVRGNSTTNLNTDRKHTTQLTGDVVFETPATPEATQNSGNLINAYVNAVLVGSDSYWNGRSYQEYKVKEDGKEVVKHVVGLNNDASYQGNVTGFALTLADGAKWTLTDDSFVNTLTLEGGTVDATKATTFNVGTYENGSTKAGFTIQGTGNKLILGEKTTLGGSIILKKGAELETSLATAYTGATIESGALTLAEQTTGRLTFVEDATNGTGTLVISDTFTYDDKAKVATLKDIYSAVSLNLVNATYKGKTPTTLLDNVIQSTANAQVSVDENADTVTIGASSSNSDTAVTTGAATVTLTKAADVTVKANSAVTLVGTADGGDFVANANKLTVDGGATLNLGSVNSATATSGALPDLTLEENANLNVENTTVTTTALVGAEGVTINVGSSEAAGVLHTEELKLGGGLIFIDPAWSGNDEIANASFMSVGTVGTDSLNGAIVAGQNSVLALGADKATAVAGFKALAKNNPSLTWAEQGDSAVTAALYLGQPITLTEASKILVDGSKTVAPSADDVSAGVTIASKGLLMIDQASVGSSAAISGGKLALTEGSYIGLVNATGGNLTLTTDASNTSGTATVVTDNPFVTAELSSNTIVATTNTASGLSALASTGIQAMTRRADSILAQTIADRTSVDQELGAGANLWVDVAGETYEADKLDNNASFKADMGYGAFGGEFGIGDSVTAGAAIQYGKGSLRSSVSSIKNKIDSYGATLYGTMKFGESKVVADIAYVKNTNDITSSQTALNQKPDAQMYSIGVRGQHRFTAGNFQIVPSVGVRVSRLETDAMAIGSVRVDKQKQTIVQVPIAVRINGMTQNAAGWSVSPSFKVAYVPTFGDKEITALGADQTVIDTSPVQADFGIRAQKGNLMLNANFMAGAGNDGASSIGGKVGLKYVF